MVNNKYDDKTEYMKGYKIRIYPTESQALVIDKRIDISIAIYNWTIEQEKNQYELYLDGKSNKKFLSYYDLINLFTKFRNENPWVKEIPHGTGCKAIQRAFNAFKMFFKTSNRFPKFKSKKHLRKKSFGIRHDTVYFNDNMLRIEGFPKGEMIYTKWHSGFSNNYYDENRLHYYNPVITKDNLGRYYISFSLIANKKSLNINFDINNPIGIDLNVKDRFVCSNGYRSGSPDLTKLKNRLSKAERAVQLDIERNKKEARNKSLEYSSIERSKRACKRLDKRRKIANKISNIVENFIQNETNKIVNMKPTTIVMEDLSVNDMDKNHNVSKNIHYSNFSRCIQVMRNKCNKYNIPFMTANKNFPSSQLCSNCGSRKKIFTQKVYKCPICGMEMDRDFNAAINLMKLAL